MARRVWPACGYCGLSRRAHLDRRPGACASYVGEVGYQLTAAERELSEARRARLRGVRLRPARSAQARARSFASWLDPLGAAAAYVSHLEEAAGKWRSRIAGDLIASKLHRYDPRMSMSGDPSFSRLELAAVELELSYAREALRLLERIFYPVAPSMG